MFLPSRTDRILGQIFVVAEQADCSRLQRCALHHRNHWHVDSYLLAVPQWLTRRPFIVTTHHKHAWEVAKAVALDKYDAIVTVSGDGLVYEVLNGFAEHAEPMRAFRIPVVPVPAGSANALALNLLGLQVSVPNSHFAANKNLCLGRIRRIGRRSECREW